MALADEEPDERSDDEQSDFPGAELANEVRSVCPYCGGVGRVADPKLAIIGGVPRTIDNGRPCRGCHGVGYLAGLLPPM
jgi:hypothetical protein